MNSAAPHDTVPELAVIVISLRSPPELVDAVNSVLDPGLEVVVVNSGGGDTSDLLATAGIDVPVFEVDAILYPGAARNIGICKTKARWISFLASDCLADPNWASERLRLHKAGADLVASSMMPDRPDSLVAWAHHLLLFPARLPGLPASAALRYGVSFDRRLFEIFGLFDESLRSGEDTEFLSRVPSWPEVIWWAPTVITRHRNATNIAQLLWDQVLRGYRQALAMQQIRGTSPTTLARSTLSEPARAACFVKDGLNGSDRELAMASLRLVRLGSLAKTLGNLMAIWRSTTVDRSLPKQSDS